MIYHTNQTFVIQMSNIYIYRMIIYINSLFIYFTTKIVALIIAYLSDLFLTWFRSAIKLSKYLSNVASNIITPSLITKSIYQTANSTASSSNNCTDNESFKYQRTFDNECQLIRNKRKNTSREYFWLLFWQPKPATPPALRDLLLTGLSSNSRQ